MTLHVSGDSHSLASMAECLLAHADDTFSFGGHRDNIALRRLGPALQRSGLGVVFPPLHEDAPGVPFLPRRGLWSPSERNAALRAYHDVLEQGAMTSGPMVATLERDMASFCGRRRCIATSSGTDALIIVLRALGVGFGDEVILPANSFAATENAVLANGAVPVLADVDASHFNLDPVDVGAKITTRTKAILPVDLYGRRAPGEALRAIAQRHGLALVEDACQAIGLPDLGRDADAAILSFNPVKNFGVCGKGGAILTDDETLADRCVALRYHGFRPGEKHFKSAPMGFNSGMDDAVAATGCALLPFLSLNNLRRQILARRYADLLAPLSRSGALRLPALTPDHVWHLYPVLLGPGLDVQDLRQRRRSEHAVEVERYYPCLTHHQRTPLHHGLYRSVRLPVTENIHRRLIHLPLHQSLTLGQQQQTAEALAAVLDANRVGVCHAAPVTDPSSATTEALP